MAGDDVFEFLVLEPKGLLVCLEKAPNDRSACDNLDIVVSSDKDPSWLKWSQ